MSRQICLNELISAGLLTHAEKAEAHASSLDSKDRIFVVHIEIEPEVLRAVGFVEQDKEYVN